jgi:PTH1 family peptidyl-tRNA hydrolase
LLIVGLRNPGSQYEGTRHNVGAAVVAETAHRAGTGFKKARRFIRAELAETRLGEVPAVLALPRTFMNNSGQAVAPLAKYYGVDSESMLVVHDDIDLPFAKLKVQFGRGPGGHNGITSVVNSMQTRNFWRLKVGVGRPPGRQDPADYVLRRFSGSEQPEMDLTLQYGADLVELFATDGPEMARQRAGEMGTAG